LLDGNLEPVPIGVSGEMYIGGEGLARGYLNNPALTADRFIPDQFGSEPGARSYRTGDVGIYNAEGKIEYVGRNDFQVKLRGVRIELGEIESALREHENVAEAAVTVIEDGAAGKSMVAFVAPVGGRPIDTRELREFLRQRLADYMAPARYQVVTSFAKTASGKIDRARLPAPRSAPEEREKWIEPASVLEKTIAAIWSEVLGRERIGVEDNFFELGGHSLVATQVVTRLREAIGEEMALTKIFEEPTVRGLAASFVSSERREEIEKRARIWLRVRGMSEEEAETLLKEKKGMAG
jgi:acyl carrier protein